MTDTLDIEQTTVEMARSNLPTPERIAKGDVVTYGRADWNPDVVDDRAMIPTARVRVTKSRIRQLLDAGILDDDQYRACCDLRLYWHTNIHAVITRMRIATWQNSGLPRAEWQEQVEEVLHRQWCYNFLRNPDNGLPTHELNMLELVVCDERTISEVLSGRKHTKTGRFIAMVDRMMRVLEKING